MRLYTKIAGLLTLLVVAAEADEPVVRSLADSRQRPFNELSEPRFQVRQTSQGWEFRSRQVTVIARQREIAQQAAALVSESWRRTDQLVGLWNRVPQRPQFALGAIQVVIDSEPQRGFRAQPTLQTIGQESILIYLNNSEESGSLAQQKTRLAVAASKAYFVASGLQQKIPGPIVNGLSGFVARQQFGEKTPLVPLQVARTNRIAGARRPSSTSEAVASSLQASTQRVQFLLFGNDARHAVRFIRLLARASAQQKVSVAKSDWNQLLSQTDGEFKKWRENEGMGQPLRAPAQTKALDAAQRELTFLLKLADRFGRPQDVRVQPKVFEKTEQGFRAVAPRRNPPPFRSIGELTRRALQSGQTWATLDSLGQLRFSTDADFRRELAKLAERYQFIQRDNRLEVVAAWEGGRTLAGWLEPNRDAPLRPLAKFELRDRQPSREESR